MCTCWFHPPLCSSVSACVKRKRKETHRHGALVGAGGEVRAVKQQCSEQDEHVHGGGDAAELISDGYDLGGEQFPPLRLVSRSSPGVFTRSREIIFQETRVWCWKTFVCPTPGGTVRL